MTKILETVQHLIGTEFDEILIHSARIYQVLKGRTDRVDLDRVRAWMRYYLERSYPERPGRFFSFPRKAPAAEVIYERPYSDGTVRTYAFRSGYKVRNPDFRESFLQYEENRTAYLVHWTHGDAGRKTIVCCHGWSLGDPRQAERMFRVPKLFSLGLDVALFISPCHWKRAPSLWQRFSPPFPFRDPVFGLEGLGQAMYDLGSSFLLLEREGASRIGLIGASMGGYLSALFVSLSRKAELVTLVVPFLNFESLKTAAGPFSHSGQGDAAAEEVRREVSAIWRIHSPFSHTCKLTPGRCLLIASRGDRLCPFSDVERLYEHWGRPKHLFLRGGHSLFFPRRGRGEAWYRFLEEHGFI